MSDENRLAERGDYVCVVPGCLFVAVSDGRCLGPHDPYRDEVRRGAAKAGVAAARRRLHKQCPAVSGDGQTCDLDEGHTGNHMTFEAET